MNDDKEIIARVLNGDRESYSVLIDAYKVQIFNLCFRITGNYQESEDLAQDTFLKVYKQLNKYNPEKPFFTWLYSISLNLIRNHLKRKKIENLLLDSVAIQDAYSNPENDLINLQDNVHIQNCIMNLRPDLREAIILRFFQNLKLEDAAQVCGITLSAFKMRLYRALVLLKSTYQKKD